MRVDATWKAFDAAGAAAGGAGTWTYVSSLPFSCAEEICPAFAGSIPTKFDQVHLTTAYSEHIAPALRRILTEAAVL